MKKTEIKSMNFLKGSVPNKRFEDIVKKVIEDRKFNGKGEIIIDHKDIKRGEAIKIVENYPKAKKKSPPRKSK